MEHTAVNKFENKKKDYSDNDYRVEIMTIFSEKFVGPDNYS